MLVQRKKVGQKAGILRFEMAKGADPLINEENEEPGELRNEGSGFLLVQCDKVAG